MCGHHSKDMTSITYNCVCVCVHACVVCVNVCACLHVNSEDLEILCVGTEPDIPLTACMMYVYYNRSDVLDCAPTHSILSSSKFQTFQDTIHLCRLLCLPARSQSFSLLQYIDDS